MLLPHMLCATLAATLPLAAAQKLAPFPPKTPTYDITNPYNVTVIPVAGVGCLRPQVNWTDVAVAKDKLKKWGARGGKIPPGAMRGKAENFAGAWICNCKHFYKDHAPAAETEEAYRVVEGICSDNGGWVWSHKWQKSWNFGDAGKMREHEYPSTKCPM